MRINKKFARKVISASPFLLVPFFLTACGSSDSDPIPAQLTCVSGESGTSAAGKNAAPQTMPSLHTWSGGSGTFSIKSKRIVIDANASVKLADMADRFAGQLKVVTGILPSVAKGAAIAPGDIALSMSSCSSADAGQIGSEGYKLSVQDAVTIRANTENGIFYGTQSVLQMLSLDGNAVGQHVNLSKGIALDYPQLGDRSLSLDVARKFASVEFLKSYIEFMGAYKMNELHLHLSDQISDASGNYVLRTFRLKSSNPAFNNPVSSDGLYYSQNDWASLEATAAANGVKIVPEFDTPGHAGALVIARPDLAYKGDAGTLDPVNPATLVYVKSVFDEFLPWFKSGIVHIGGDEVNVNGGSVTAQQQISYLNSLGSYLESEGKTVQFWGDEQVAMAGGLKRSFVAQRWMAVSPDNSLYAYFGPLANFDWSAYVDKWIESAAEWYVVPFQGLYRGSLAGTDVYSGWYGVSTTTPKAAGGQISVWNDCAIAGSPYCHSNPAYSWESDIHAAIKESIPGAGQTFWAGQIKDSSGNLVPYSQFQTTIASYQYGPGNAQLLSGVALSGN
jgi:hexosaminidase